jgi:hypothetical protein
MNSNGAKSWMVLIYNPRTLCLKRGPLTWDEALLLIEEERNAGMLPLLDYVPDEPEPQSWKDIELDEPLDSP